MHQVTVRAKVKVRCVICTSNLPIVKCVTASDKSWDAVWDGGLCKVKGETYKVYSTVAV